MLRRMNRVNQLISDAENFSAGRINHSPSSSSSSQFRPANKCDIFEDNDCAFNWHDGDVGGVSNGTLQCIATMIMDMVQFSSVLTTHHISMNNIDNFCNDDFKRAWLLTLGQLLQIVLFPMLMTKRKSGKLGMLRHMI